MCKLRAQHPPEWLVSELVKRLPRYREPKNRYPLRSGRIGHYARGNFATLTESLRLLRSTHQIVLGLLQPRLQHEREFVQDRPLHLAAIGFEHSHPQ